MMNGLRGAAADERGMTLVELIVAMMILGIAMAIFTTTLASVQRGIVRQDQFSRTNDQARLALQQLDRQMRSGNVLYDPATEPDPYYMVRIYTQANAPTLGSFSCVQWKIDAAKQLSTRWWPPENPAAVTAWRVVATGIVNKSLGVRAFELDADPAKAGRTLNVALRVNEDPNGTTVQATELRAAFTGRNVAFGFPVTVCSPAPA